MADVVADWLTVYVQVIETLPEVIDLVLELSHFTGLLIVILLLPLGI